MRISYNFNKKNPVVKAEDGTSARRFSHELKQDVQPSDNTYTEKPQMPVRYKFNDRALLAIMSNMPQESIKHDLKRADAKKIENNKQQNILRFFDNFLKSPSQALIDASLYAGDVLGLPSNATNYLRDLNVSIPYRLSSAVRAAYHTIKDGTAFSDNYTHALRVPSWYEKMHTINPLVNTKENFSDEELNLLYKMAGDKGYIDNADIKRVSPSGKYGSAGSITGYFSPFNVVQTAVGQMSHDPNGYLQDSFDVNTQSEVAKHDNNMYINMMFQHPGLNYQTIRATMPYVNSIDIMPDEYKVQTKITKDD